MRRSRPKIASLEFRQNKPLIEDTSACDPPVSEDILAVMTSVFSVPPCFQSFPDSSQRDLGAAGVSLPVPGLLECHSPRSSLLRGEIREFLPRRSEERGEKENNAKARSCKARIARRNVEIRRVFLTSLLFGNRFIPARVLCKAGRSPAIPFFSLL
jgi:hypothetical protein